MASTAESWLLTSKEDGVCETNLGILLITTVSKIFQSSIKHNMKPALEFIDVMCSKLTELSEVPLFWYLYWIQLNNSKISAFQSRAAEIMNQNAGLENFRDLKFEKCLTTESATKETKTFFVGEFLKNLDLEELRKSVISNEENSKAETSVSNPQYSETLR